MVAAGAILKFLYPKLFQMTCVSYLLYNCAMKIKYLIKDVDQLIAKLKLTTIRIKIKHANFYTRSPLLRYVRYLTVVQLETSAIRVAISNIYHDKRAAGMALYICIRE